MSYTCRQCEQEFSEDEVYCDPEDDFEKLSTVIIDKTWGISFFRSTHTKIVVPIVAQCPYCEQDVEVMATISFHCSIGENWELDEVEEIDEVVIEASHTQESNGIDEEAYYSDSDFADDHPDNFPDDHPDNFPDDHPENNPDDHPENNPDDHPENNPDELSGYPMEQLFEKLQLDKEGKYRGEIYEKRKEAEQLLADNDKVLTRYFYHCTTPNNRDMIKKDGALLAHKHKANWYPCPLSDMSLKGVYFSGLAREDGQPRFTTSPYGSERVKISSQLYGTYRIFYASHHTINNNLYIVLVLISSDDPGAIECEKKLSELDANQNVFLRLSDDGVYINNKWCFIELFVVGDVRVTTKTEWDTVKCTGRF